MPTQTSLVTGVDFVTVPTKDYDAAAKFYGEVLGLPFGKRWGNMPAGEFETGNLTIAVMQSDAFGLEFAAAHSPRSLSGSTTSRSGAPSCKCRACCSPATSLDSGVCHQAFFEDPDGNKLILHHRYAPPKA